MRISDWSSDVCSSDLEGGDLRPFASHEACYVQYSSGSTSLPRGVFVSQRAITSNARGIGRHGLSLRPGDRATSWLPLYHDMGLVGFCLTPMLNGETLVLAEGFDPQAIWRLLVGEGATYFVHMPIFYRYLLEHAASVDSAAVRRSLRL